MTCKGTHSTSFLYFDIEIFVDVMNLKMKISLKIII